MRHLITFVAALLAVSIHSGIGAAEISHKALADGSGHITINGEIGLTDSETFRQASLRYRKAVVTLNSDGGLLLPAIEIGRIIQITGYETVVPDNAICASSCALIWVAGSSRYLSSNGKVGFHASYRNNNGRFEESGVANALIGNYLTLLNLPQKAIVFATSAPPNSIIWLSRLNRKESGINFELVEESGSERTSVLPTPPPIQTTSTPYPTKLPPHLPSSLSASGEHWVEFISRVYFDSRSLRLVEDIYGKKAGRQIWILVDYKGIPNSENLYSLQKIFIYCPDQIISFYEQVDVLKSGRRKKIDDLPRMVSIEPGSVFRVLSNRLCR